ncbi:hypothetical protein BJ741DRAFT_707076 [Chytriomyces cf. hyalinus JEL632]|nr:hypothetical protein BJ741DRAFT_707076 [Chytriomyces cf. hyalinus JEL632]
MSETEARPQRWADKLRAVMQSKMFHLSIIYLVLFELSACFRSASPVVEAKNHQYTACRPLQGSASREQRTAPRTEILFWLSVTILFIFFIEIVTSAVLFGLKHFRNPINVFDATIITAAIVMEMYFHFSGLESSGSNAVIILRIFKLVRGMHAVAHAAAFQARQRVHQLEKINRHIAERARIMNRALSIAHSKIERLFETMAPMQSGETQSVKMEICEVYEHLKLVVSNGENGLEAELETLIQNEEFISDVTQASNVEAVSEKSEFIRNK